MADFRVRISSPIYVQPWRSGSDFPVGDPRLNPQIGIHHLYLAVELGSGVTLACTPDETGVEGDIDANLGGRLFSWRFVECLSQPAIVTGAGQSSIGSVVPAAVGHYLLFVDRPSGGGIGIHFDCVGVRTPLERQHDGAQLLLSGAAG